MIASPPAETITVDQCARRLGISRSLAYMAIAAGELPSIRIGKRIVVPVAGIDAMFEAAVVEPAGAARGVTLARSPRHPWSPSRRR